MTRRGVGATVAVGAPVVGAVVSGIWALTGDRRQLLLSFAVAALPLWIGAGLATIAVVGVAVIASRRRAAARVAAARADGVAEGRTLEHEARRRFLARLDHELKNPITAIRAILAGAGDTAPDAPLAAVDGQARRLAALVGDLRKLSEIETRPLDQEPVDLEHLIGDAVTAVAQQHPEIAARVVVTVSRVPWPVPVLPADPDLLALALDNVLGNAAKFAASGPIEVRLREDAGWAVIEVADTGRGVPPDAQTQVFDELARAENARDVAGSGIGLALVRTILRRHGGDAQLRSREGAGTVVTLRLPIPR